jgi:threonine 3-dehydrogenase
MKSLSKAKRAPGIWLTEIDTPDIGPTEVLIAITKTAICGTES